MDAADALPYISTIGLDVILIVTVVKFAWCLTKKEPSLRLLTMSAASLILAWELSNLQKEKTPPPKIEVIFLFLTFVLYVAFQVIKDSEIRNNS
jgi:hypothetical protein